MKPIPSDFEITDEHREYAIRKGWPKFLPDVYLESFKDVFDPDHGGNGRKHKNWDLTFYRFLRQASPSGDFYKPEVWDRRVHEAKRRERDTWKPPIEAKLKQVPTELTADQRERARQRAGQIVERLKAERAARNAEPR